VNLAGVKFSRAGAVRKIGVPQVPSAAALKR
jgi:hypothetical protein